MTYNTISDGVTMPGGEGTLLANRYRIVRQLGQGGMGSVWLAEDTQLDNKPFAIKMLPSVLVSNKRAYNQLKSEALVAMKLTHTNIVTLRAFEENNGNPFLVMDYIDGQTLDDYLAEKGKLSEDETIKLLMPIALALDYAHGEGVVHRDVKPANILIRKDGHPYILDFGIAREIQETMTRVTGKLSSGTLLYMSPEQLHGAAPKKEQDIYSFAAMVYECLSGNPPFIRGQIEYQIDNDTPEPLADCISAGTSKSIAESVVSGLAKKPEDRPLTCVAVVECNGSYRDAELRRKEGDRQVSITGGSPVRGGAWKIVAALAVIGFAAVGGWLWRQYVQKESPRRSECYGATVEQKPKEMRMVADESQRMKDTDYLCQLKAQLDDQKEIMRRMDATRREIAELGDDTNSAKYAELKASLESETEELHQNKIKSQAIVRERIIKENEAIKAKNEALKQNGN